jgi:hypothetical protein
METDNRIQLENELDSLTEATVENWMERCFEYCDPRYDTDWLNGMLELAQMQFPDNYEVRSACSRAAVLDAQRLANDGDSKEAIRKLEQLLELDPYCTEGFELLEQLSKAPSGESQPAVAAAPIVAAPVEPTPAPVVVAAAPSADPTLSLLDEDDSFLDAALPEITESDDFLNMFEDDELFAHIEIEEDLASSPEQVVSSPSNEVVSPVVSDSIENTAASLEPVAAAEEPAIPAWLTSEDEPEISEIAPIETQSDSPSVEPPSVETHSSAETEPVSAEPAPAVEEPILAVVEIPAPAEIPEISLPEVASLEVVEEEAPRVVVAPQVEEPPVAAPAISEPPVVAQVDVPVISVPQVAPQPTIHYTAPAANPPSATTTRSSVGGWDEFFLYPRRQPPISDSPQYLAAVISLVQQMLSQSRPDSALRLLVDHREELAQRSEWAEWVSQAVTTCCRNLENEGKGSSALLTATWGAKQLPQATELTALQSRLQGSYSMPSLPTVGFGPSQSSRLTHWFEQLRANPSDQQMLMDIFQELGDNLEQFLQLFRSLAVEMPENADQVLNLGWAYLQVGPPALALVHIQRGLRLQSSLRGQQLLVDVYAKLGQEPLRQSALQRLHELYPQTGVS